MRADAPGAYALLASEPLDELDDFASVDGFDDPESEPEDPESFEEEPESEDEPEPEFDDDSFDFSLDLPFEDPERLSVL
jgi:hypothetical protein